MEYIQCKSCSVSILKVFYRKHILEHGMSACKGCDKQFTYDKRLVDHIEKIEKCGQFYRSNQIEIPVLKPDHRRNSYVKKKDRNSDFPEAVKDRNSDYMGELKEEDSAVSSISFYICPTCGEDLLKPNIDLFEHKTGLCASKANIGQFVNGNRSEEVLRSKKSVNDTLSEDIIYDEDDPMSEEVPMEKECDEPEQKRPRISNEHEKDLFSNVTVDSNSSYERVEDDQEVTLDEGNSSKVDSKEGKKKYSLELRISTIARIEKEGLNSIKAISADIQVKLGVVHKWWLRKDKLKLLHDLKLEKARLELEEFTKVTNAGDNKHDVSDEINVEGNSRSSETLLNELQLGLNETGKFLNELEANEPTNSGAEHINYKQNVLSYQSEATLFSASDVFQKSNPDNPLPIQKKSKPCQVCLGCKAVECAECKHCKDKPKFGGNNSIRQRCIMKLCEKMQEEKRLKESLRKRVRKPFSKRQHIRKIKTESMDDLEDFEENNLVKEEILNERNENMTKETEFGQFRGSYSSMYGSYNDVEQSTMYGMSQFTPSVSESGNNEHASTNEECVEVENSNRVETCESDEESFSHNNEIKPNNPKDGIQAEDSEIYSKHTETTSELRKNIQTTYISENLEERYPSRISSLKDRFETNPKENLEARFSTEEIKNSSVISGRRSRTENFETSNLKETFHPSNLMKNFERHNPTEKLVSNYPSEKVGGFNLSVNDKRNSGDDEKNYEREPKSFSFQENAYNNAHDAYENSRPQVQYYNEDKENLESSQNNYLSEQSLPNSSSDGLYRNESYPGEYNPMDAVKVTKRKRANVRCRTCGPCVAKDCESCKPCVDMVKFGGLGKMRKSCVYRKCENQANRKSSDSVPNKRSPSGLGYQKQEESQFLLSSFINDKYLNQRNTNRVDSFQYQEMDDKSESKSLGKLMDFVNNHEVINKENAEQPISLKENEQERKELENALGSIGAESSNDWLNNGELFMQKNIRKYEVKAPIITIDTEQSFDANEAVDDEESRPELEIVEDSLQIDESVEESAMVKAPSIQNFLPSRISNMDRFPAGLEILPSTKTPSEEVFIANEVTITKKVRQAESSQELSQPSNYQSSSIPIYGQDPNPIWPPQPVSSPPEQQFSVLSNQHPSISKSGLSITKINQSYSQNKMKSQKLKEFNINKILSKLQPVPVSGSGASPQLNFTSRDLTPLSQIFNPAQTGLSNYGIQDPQNDSVQNGLSNYGNLAGNNASVYHLGESINPEKLNNQSQGYINSYKAPEYYQDNPYGDNSSKFYQSPLNPSYSSLMSLQTNHGTTNTVSSVGNNGSASVKPVTNQSLRLEDYINNEEATSIQDILMNDSLNKNQNIKVEVDEDENRILNENHILKPTVISFQNSISESLPPTKVESSEISSLPNLIMKSQSKLAHLSSLQIELKTNLTHSKASLQPNNDRTMTPEESLTPSVGTQKINKDLLIRKAEKKFAADMKKLEKLESQNIVTLFPTGLEESNDASEVTDGLGGSDESGINLTKTYRISKQQIDKFRTISSAVVKNEMSHKEAAKVSGLDEEIVKTWVDTLEDILATNQEAVEKARKYEEMKKHVGSLAKKLGDLQNMVQLTSVVKRERETVPELSTFTPLAENVPIDLSLRIPKEEQQQFTRVTDMINKMFA